MGMAHATVHSTNRDYEYVETKHRDSVWFAYSDSNAHAEHQGQWSKVNGGLWTIQTSGSNLHLLLGRRILYHWAIWEIESGNSITQTDFLKRESFILAHSHLNLQALASGAVWSRLKQKASDLSFSASLPYPGLWLPDVNKTSPRAQSHFSYLS